MKGNRVLKAGIGYIIGNYLIKGLTFLTIPIFTRIMSTSDYGTYNIFVAYEGIFVYLIGMGFETSLKKAYFKYGSMDSDPGLTLHYEGYASTVVSIIFVNALIWISLALLFHNQVTKLLQLDLPSIVMLMLFSMGNAVVLCYNAHVSITYNYKGYVKLGAINAIGSIVLSILLITLVFKEKAYLGRMLGSTSVITLLAFFVLFFFLRIHKPEHIKEYISWGVRFCLPVVPHGISQVILVNFDRIMIGRMIGSEASGIYSFAYNIFSIIYVTYRSLDPVWGTWFFERMNERNYGAIKKYSSIYMLVVLLLSSVVMLMSPELVILLGSSKYSDATYCVIPIVAGGFFTFLYSLPCQIEYYREKTKHLAFATVCAALVNIILNYIFIQKIGYVAAAYTTLVTYILYFLFHFFLAYKIEGRQLFSGTAIIACSLIILCVSALALCTLQHVLVRYGIIVVMLVGVSIYVRKEYREIIMELIDKHKTK